MKLSKNKYINLFLENNQKIKSSLIHILESDVSLFFRNRNYENMDYFKNIISDLEINKNSDYQLTLSTGAFEQKDSVIFKIFSNDSNIKIVFFVRYEKEILNKKAFLIPEINFTIQNHLNKFNLISKDKNKFSITDKNYNTFFLFSNDKIISAEGNFEHSIEAFFSKITDYSIINISDFILHNNYTHNELKEIYELLFITKDLTPLPKEYIINIEDYKNDRIKKLDINLSSDYI